ncbi:alanine-tRNA ligase [Fusarium heterosporum]|uniref:Alanine-tRNA ligase n=1 Tax=Fusarium heterosporum TaxID=42747 RepID=A0A8H5TYM4_FUSHE|nr:alanine-tRNA ligase [Fusarium heterosporum]
MSQSLRDRIFSKPADPQMDCPLFRILPAEVRDEIFSYALTDHPDPTPSQQFKEKTCYVRPSYLSAQSTDTRLLRTCRAIYRETWFKPYTLREHTQWISSLDRAPPTFGMTSGKHLDRTLWRIARQLGQKRVEVERLRVFAQMYKLEEGDLAFMLRKAEFVPRTVTLTIRHTDWWYWENDDPLSFKGDWITDVSRAMTSSTNQFCIELESLERKKDQVDKIADQMIKKWFFKRPDGVVLYAEASGKSIKTSRWRGSSIWHGQRWIRDETEPEKLDYYIVSVTFRPKIEIERNGGTIDKSVLRSAQEEKHFFEELCIPGQGRIEDDQPFMWWADNSSENDEMVCSIGFD